MSSVPSVIVPTRSTSRSSRIPGVQMELLRASKPNRAQKENCPRNRRTRLQPQNLPLPEPLSAHLLVQSSLHPLLAPSCPLHPPVRSLHLFLQSLLRVQSLLLGRSLRLPLVISPSFLRPKIPPPPPLLPIPPQKTMQIVVRLRNQLEKRWRFLVRKTKSKGRRRPWRSH